MMKKYSHPLPANLVKPQVWIFWNEMKCKENMQWKFPELEMKKKPSYLQFMKIFMVSDQLEDFMLLHRLSINSLKLYDIFKILC